MTTTPLVTAFVLSLGFFLCFILVSFSPSPSSSSSPNTLINLSSTSARFLLLDEERALQPSPDPFSRNTSSSDNSDSRGDDDDDDDDDDNNVDNPISPIGVGFASFDGTYDPSRLRAAVLFVPLSSVTDTPITSSSSSAARSAHAAIGLVDFALGLKSKVSLRGGFHNFLSNIRLHFGSTVSSSVGTLYGRVAVTVTSATRRLTTSLEDKPSFIPSALHEILSLSPARVFDKYGTHVVTGVRLGGEVSLWGSISPEDKTCHESCTSSASSDTKCFESAFDSFVSGTDAESCVQAVGLTVVGGARLGSSIDAWVAASKSDSASTAIAFAPDGAAPLWVMLRRAGHGRKAWILEQYYFKEIAPRHTYVVKRFAGPWAPASGTPDAGVSVPSGWKILSGGVELSAQEEEGGEERYGQLVTRSYPRTSKNEANYDDEETQVDSVHALEFGDVQSKQRSQPVNGKDIFAWEVQAKDHLHIATGSVRAIAVAVWDPDNVLDVSVSSAGSNMSQMPTAIAKVQKGYTLISGGGSVQWVQPGCLLTSSAPLGDFHWKAGASDHLVSSAGTITSFAIGVRRTDGGTVGVKQFSSKSAKGSGSGVEHVMGLDDDSDGMYRYIAAGAQIIGKNGFVTGMDIEGNGEYIYARAGNYVTVEKFQLRLTGVALRGAVYVEREESVGLLGQLPGGADSL